MNTQRKHQSIRITAELNICICIQCIRAYTYNIFSLGIQSRVSIGKKGAESINKVYKEREAARGKTSALEGVSLRKTSFTNPPFRSVLSFYLYQFLYFFFFAWIICSAAFVRLVLGLGVIFRLFIVSRYGLRHSLCFLAFFFLLLCVRFLTSWRLTRRPGPYIVTVYWRFDSRLVSCPEAPSTPSLPSFLPFSSFRLFSCAKCGRPVCSLPYIPYFTRVYSSCFSIRYTSPPAFFLP